MANILSIVVDAVYKGRDTFRAAEGDISKLNNVAASGASKLSSVFRSAAVGIGVAGVAFGAVALAAGKAWQTIGEGAALVRTQQRFEKLAESIGSTANVLTAKLRAATHGTIADMELMASASQLVALRLADTEDQVVRLGAVSGVLNWDMRQVILTFANMSTMRLDALGLSVSDVTSKARELELQGMSSQEAFKEAVILAGEAQAALLNVGDDAVRGMQQAQASWQNSVDSLKMGAANVASQVGLSSALFSIGDALSEIGKSEADIAIKRTAEALAFANAVATSGSYAFKGQSTELAGLLALSEEGRSLFQKLKTGDYTQQEKALELLYFYRDVYGDTAEAAQMFDAEIAKLNKTMAEQAERAALVAAGGRDISEVYTEWATATKAVGEQAQGFLKTFNDAIGGITTANVDAGPLISLGQAADGVSISAGSMQFSLDAASVALYQEAQAAGASAGELALLGVATGQFTEAEADAALKTAILQEAIKRLASDYAEGEISVYGMVDALREQMAVIAGMPSMFAAAAQSSRQLNVLTGGSSGGSWYRPNAPLIRRDVEEIERAGTAVGGFTQQVDHLAEAHKRLASAFSAEVNAAPEGGLIDAAGVVNMENANKALYEQAQAAGATAAQLAMLGVATGQFTEEQAQAALKAAILQERIKQIAAGVASGELSYSDAAGGLASFGEALNAGAIGDAAGGIEALSTAAADFANSSYEAELSVEDQAALTAINDVAAALGGITGTHYIHLVTTTNDGTPSTDAPGRIGIERNAYTVDTRQSGFIGGGGATRMLEWQGDGGGSGAADNRTAYNVTVNNYIDGQKTSNRQLEDITTDKLRAALNSLGVRR